MVAYVPADGCSAAYWIASAASSIVASQTALLGSIGIVMTYVDDSEAEKQEGVRKIEFVSSTAPKKRMDPSSDDGKKEIQAVVDAYGEIFVNAVAGFRGVTPEKVKSDFGQGGVLIGAKAVAAGLADKIGTLDDAIQAAQELAGAAGDSTPGETQRTTARATAEHGGLMAEKKTAANLRAEHAEAVAEIAAEAALAERTRISGILKYNTAAYRAVAGAQIDAALEDGKTTAADLAVTILDAQTAKRSKVAADRQEDADEIEIDEPDIASEAPEAVAQAKKGGKVQIDTGSVYDRMNGRASKEQR